MKKKGLLKTAAAVAASAVLALALAGCSGGGSGAASASGSASASAGEYDGLESVVLIGADSTGEGAAGQIFGQYVAQRVDEITGGKLTIDYHPNGDLGGDADLLRQMQRGDIDIVVCQTAPIVNFVPEMAVFDLPMVFSTADGDTIEAALNGKNDFTAALDKAYEAVGLHRLGFLQNATFRLATANKELNTLDDYKGLQIRTMENSNHMDFWKAIGAEPTPKAWGELYIALQNGNVNAQENAADTCVGASFQEVQKYLACTNHILYCNQISMNSAKYAGLDPKYQAALDQAVAEAIDYMRPQMAKIDSDAKDTLVKGGMSIIEYDQSFFDQILALDGVKTLYDNIDKQVNGLGTLLVSELNKK